MSDDLGVPVSLDALIALESYLSARDLACKFFVCEIEVPTVPEIEKRLLGLFSSPIAAFVWGERYTQLYKDMDENDPDQPVVHIRAIHDPLEG